MKKKVKAASKGQKGERLGAVEGEQKGESGSETAAQRGQKNQRTETEGQKCNTERRRKQEDI